MENQTVAGPQCSLYCQSQFGTATVWSPTFFKNILTDVNICGAVQYIDTAAPKLQLIECLQLHDTTIFLQKKIMETLSGPLLAKCVPSAGIYCCAPSLKYYGIKKTPTIGVKIEL